ncbi:response regulator [Variovorax sp. RHLX14]|uniref:hybrid sensor histidine kinase/response regulator n=1 Tax=Variovorax sp. RHLX14 TaxID=1259731 RepID=UPI003F44DBA7
MAKHARSHLGAQAQLSERRLMVTWGIAGCGVVVLLEVAFDFVHGFKHDVGFGVALALTLGLLCAALKRRYPSDLFELLAAIAACAWVVSGIGTHGTDGLVWAYASIAALMLIAPSRYSEVFAACVVICTGIALWQLKAPAVPFGAIALIFVFTALMKLYKVSMSSQCDAVDARRVRLELLLRCSDAGCLEWNDVDRSAHYSPRLCEMLGLPPDVDTLRMEFWSHLPPGFRSRVKDEFTRQLDSVTKPYESMQLQSMEYPLIRQDKTRIWVHARAIRISDRYGAMARYVCTFVDITARFEIERHLRAVNAGVEARTREIIRQHAALEKTLHTREEVERISRHDLKTPLVQIASITDTLRNVRRPVGEEEALLMKLEATARRAMKMLKLSVDFYPIEDGRYEFTPEPVDMVSMVCRVCDTFSAQAATKQIGFSLHPELSELWAQADVVLCETILENLMKNAIEAAPEGSRITVRIRDGSKVRVSIHNRGAVPTAVRANFFHKYSTAGKMSGTGLGTYSAQLMAKAQSGQIRMSTSETKGTVLTLELMPVLGGLGRVDIGQRKSETQQIFVARSILVVDDDAYSAIAVAGMVETHGAVQTVLNGHAAVESVMKQRPDFIFMDLEMPVMGGIEAIGKIRNYQETAGQQPSTIIAMSAHDDPLTRRRCKVAGFDRCVSKPLSRECVAQLLGRVEPCANIFPRLSASNDFSMASSQV